MYVQYNIEVCSCNHLAIGEQWILQNLRMCICSTQCAILASVAWPPLQYFSTLSHKWDNFFKKNYWIQNLFWFSLQLLSETFLNLRRTERDMIKKYIGLNVKSPVFLSSFNYTWILTDFWQILKYQISWKSVQWVPSCSVQTDRHEKANSRFSQYCECT